MDESQTLDALANLLNELADKPYNVALHSQHIRLAQSSQGLESQVHAAREMYANFLAVEEDTWIPLINAKEISVDLDSKEGLEELLALYLRAESDYLCMYSFIHSYRAAQIHPLISYSDTPKTFGVPRQPTRSLLWPRVYCKYRTIRRHVLNRVDERNHANYRQQGFTAYDKGMPDDLTTVIVPR